MLQTDSDIQPSLADILPLSQESPIIKFCITKAVFCSKLTTLGTSAMKIRSQIGKPMGVSNFGDNKKYVLWNVVSAP